MAPLPTSETAVNPRSVSRPHQRERRCGRGREYTKMAPMPMNTTEISLQLEVAKAADLLMLGYDFRRRPAIPAVSARERRHDLPRFPSATELRLRRWPQGRLPRS